jgi:hypothetical protein
MPKEEEQEEEGQEEETTPTIISKHDFYFETPLYNIISINQLEEGVFLGDVDAYSAKNHSDTTYRININEINTWSWWNELTHRHIDIGYYLIILTCKRKGDDDILRFVIYKDDDCVVKIGQYPSIADLQFSEIGKKYDKVLPPEDLKNLKKAIGLVSHGAGAGSFVYLRRIFENLIFDTYKNNSATLAINESDFKKQRMEDKIEILKSFLPSQLVEMKSIYGILSKGVHELSEEDCLKYFNPLKLSIELILDQKIESLKKLERDASVKKQLQEIQKTLKK